MASELRSAGLIRLRLRPSRALAWTVPAWATLCGAVASGEFAPTLANAVQLLLTLLLVEAGWGALWGALATTDWTTPLGRWRNWQADAATPRLPYVQPGSPADRLGRWLSQLRAWGKAVLAPAAGPALGTAAAALILSLVLAAALGLNLLSLTVCALALMQLALMVGRGRREPGVGWDGALRLGLPWLAGHLALDSLTLPSAALAAAFSIAIVGAASADHERGRVLWMAGQLASCGLLIPLHRPLAVCFVALFLAPQLLLSTAIGNPRRWPRRAWPWLAAGMLLTAWAL